MEIPPRSAARGGDVPAAAPRVLPASYYDLLEQAPSEYEGAALMRWYAEKIEALPAEDRRAARAFFEEQVARMIELDASDLDLGGPASNGRLWYRVDGNKRPYEDAGRLSAEEADVLLLGLLNALQRGHLLEHYAIDFGYSLPVEDGEKDRRFRATIYYDRQHLALSIRMLAWKPRPLGSLGFSSSIERGLLFRYVRDGLTLVTGVTGSGKSTTLDAIVDANNDDTEGHVLVVAQPLEYIHTSKKCIVRHREVGTDVDSFLDGLVQGLRQDPDIVVVGEMRDPETISAALETADNGQKVFSTLHTASAIESIDRIVAEYPSDEQERVRFRLADVLRCIISQKLLPAVGGGRVLAKEVLWMTSPARAAVKNDNAGEIYQMIWQGADQGMITLEQDLLRLVQTGDITANVAMNFANNKRRLGQMLR